MDIQQRFQAYAAAFELAYVDDDWSRLTPFFTADASYDSGDGTPVAEGREAILAKLQGAVNDLDRSMDRRDLELHRLSSDSDTVTAEWTIRFTKGDLPTLEVSGREVARFAGDAMSELKSVINPESMTSYGTWMEAHGGSL